MSSTFVGSGNKHNILNRINNLALQLFTHAISFAFGKNSIYGPQDIMKVLIYASIRKLSIEGSSEELATFIGKENAFHFCNRNIDDKYSEDVFLKRMGVY